MDRSSSAGRLSKRRERRKQVTSESILPCHDGSGFPMPGISANLHGGGPLLDYCHSRAPAGRTAVPRPIPRTRTSALRVLRDYALDSLDDDPELAAIARFTAKLCEAPVALVSLVEEERQRFLAHEGLDGEGNPARHLVLRPRDAWRRADGSAATRRSTRASPTIRWSPASRASASTPGSRSSPRKALPLGALCVIDTAPRPTG